VQGLRLAKRILIVAVSLMYLAGRSACRAIVRIGRGPFRLHPVVLTYHSVRADEVDRFREQMNDLKARAAPVFPDEATASGGRQAVAVTFDDGFQNVFDNALPILARYRIPATVFVPTGYLGTQPGWISAENRSTLGLVVSARTLSDLDDRHIRLGSHSVTHPHLDRLPGPSIDEELVLSKQALEGLTGRPLRMLSLPYGSSSPTVLDAARKAGYDLVFANVPILREHAGGSWLAGRISVSPQDWPLEFRLKAQGAYAWLALAIPAKRRVRQLIARVRTP
jgi:peptidoglycan/xylan/chitin deacetylase (PgdA/CDA1 family)